MLGDTTYHGIDEAAWALLPENRMNARLTDSDRQAVDFLLMGDPADKQKAEMPRVHAVQRILNMLNAVPADDPPANLVEATLQKIAATQIFTTQDPPAASTNI